MKERRKERISEASRSLASLAKKRRKEEGKDRGSKTRKRKIIKARNRTIREKESYLVNFRK